MLTAFIAQSCRLSLSFPSRQTEEACGRSGHLHCCLTSGRNCPVLPIMELSALGTTLADEGKHSLWWGCPAGFSLRWERNCQAVEGQAQSMLPFESLSSHFCAKFSSLAVFATPCLCVLSQKMQANTHQLLSVPSSASESFLRSC